MHYGKYKAWLWKLITLPPVLLVYCLLVSPGLRFIAPDFGQKLYKTPLPGFSRLGRYEGLDKLDLAHIFAAIMLVAVWYFLVKLMQVVFADQDYFAGKRWNREPYALFVLGTGAVFLVIDAVLFYVSLTCHGSVWGSAVFSFPAALATLLYVALNLFMAFVSFNLQQS